MTTTREVGHAGSDSGRCTGTSQGGSPLGRRRAERAVVSVTTAPSAFEGEGFPVRRAFAGVDTSALDPFIHMDQMGEVEYAPGEPKGTPWHPHRGFETVTYMIDGTFQHQDSIGGGGLITNGDTQWMTAGGGILHIEAPPEELVASGGLFHGIQLWVNLPSADKMIAPRYQDIGASQVVLGSLAGRGRPVPDHRRRSGRARRTGIDPFADGHGPCHPLARGPGRDPLAAEFNALVYVLGGRVTSVAEGRPISTGQLVVFGPGDFLTLGADTQQESRTPNLDVLILGGRPIREPVYAYGPFVMNTQDEVAQAFEDYQAGRLGTIPAEHIGS